MGPVIALAHLFQAAKGDLTALNAIYRQVDDAGADRTEIEVKDAFGEVLKEVWRKKRGKSDPAGDAL